MNAHKRDRRAPNAGHVAALLVALAAGGFLVGLGIFIAVHNQFSLREVIWGSIAIVVGAVAALWLGREARQRRRGQS